MFCGIQNSNNVPVIQFLGYIGLPNNIILFGFRDKNDFNGFP